jgi:hypothetical protein
LKILVAGQDLNTISGFPRQDAPPEPNFNAVSANRKLAKTIQAYLRATGEQDAGHQADPS